MAGLVVPLTGANVGSEQVLLGGPGESPGATVGLSAGEAVAAPSGRADDFGWPRGVVNVEPAAAEAAAPETAAADARAKSAKPAQPKSAMDAYAAQTGREQKPAIRRSTRYRGLSSFGGWCASPACRFHGDRCFPYRDRTIC